MNEKTLVILAAGMGSRFGGLKQIEVVGPNNEFIIDYSIYSALKYGFNKIVFIIKEENESIFKETIGNRISKYVKVEYAYQKNDDVVSGINIPSDRVKPLGTAHAIYCARKYLNGNFGVITSDDFYGDDAFRVLSNNLDNTNDYIIVGYPIKSTMSENGSVKRGIIIEKDGKVIDIIESSCEIENDKIKCTPLDSSKDIFYIEANHPCSMLMNGFTKNILNTIEYTMLDEFNKHLDDLDNFELLLPDIMSKDIKNGQNIKVVTTTSTWMGITYKEDLDKLKKFISNSINDGIYPNNLWN